ncbi:MAG: FAD:protein FMN transferase [Vicinamibacterales bacterium]
MRVAAVLVVVAIAGLAACDRAAAPAPAAVAVSDQRLAMGSLLRLTAWTRDPDRARLAFAEVFAEFDRLDGLLSVWREGSDVQRVNAAAGRAPVVVHEDTRRVLAAARHTSEATDGAFDITFGALADVWKFDHDQDGRVPAASAIAARLPLVDYRQVHVADGPGTAFIARAGMRIHLGGIGKGYAVDRAVAKLRAAGLHDFLIQSGGDLYVAGRNGDRPWHLGIQDPRGEADTVFATLDLTDATLSTSGDYERVFVRDGVRYHHLIDPRVGQPARGCRSVTIVSRTATEADGLSTGVFILGPERGLALVERLPDVEAVIVTADNRVLISSGLTGRVHVERPPTP